MITRIDLRHFKCFEVLKLPLKPLTLLSGINASGKSSVLQALTLLHQTMREHEWASRLMLNGATIRLGTAADVIDQEHGKRTCGITLLDDDAARFGWEFEGERHEMSMSVKRTCGSMSTGDRWDEDGSRQLRHLLPTTVDGHSLTNRLLGLTYLSAERVGPRDLYPFDAPQLASVVGPRGEFAVSILHSGRDNHVEHRLVVEGAPPTQFRQVEARMAQFFPGCVMAIDPVPRANALTLGIRVSSEMEFQRPVHTGYGLTQVLPIVVAALTAKVNDLLLIENPEVHLHPAAQGAMGNFLSLVASTGVQVMIESHSDHVLNGIRRAVRIGSLSNENVALHFFRPRQEEQERRRPQVESPSIDIHGNIDSWPEGFFDQFDHDMNYFAGWS